MAIISVRSEYPITKHLRLSLKKLLSQQNDYTPDTVVSCRELMLHTIRVTEDEWLDVHSDFVEAMQKIAGDFSEIHVNLWEKTGFETVDLVITERTSYIKDVFIFFEEFIRLVREKGLTEKIDVTVFERAVDDFENLML